MQGDIHSICPPLVVCRLAAKGQVPRYGTDFVGRTRELERLSSELDRAGGLWTLAGPGGVGKTRLAAAVAQDWQGPIYWVDLQAVQNRLGLIRNLALAMKLGPETDPLPALARGGRALVVFDNFEQLVFDCGETVNQLLAASPSLRAIATTREPLGIGVERIIEVRPMSVEEATTVFLGAAPSLLVDCAYHPVAVGAVVEQLDGLPLALELAAARLDVMTLDQLGERLKTPLPVLRDPSRPNAHHGGMATAIGRSWDLLDAQEKSILQQCTVFRGGFNLQAAEAIIHSDVEVVDGLHRLQQRRLITFSEGRFGMLEVIRQFAEADADITPVADRHRAFYVQIARACSGQINTAKMASALDILSEEYDNLRIVLNSEQADAAIAAGQALGQFLVHRGPAQAQLPTINTALGYCAPGSSDGAQLLILRAKVLAFRGLPDEARRDLDQALQDPRWRHLARLRIGILCAHLGQAQEAEQQFHSVLSADLADPNLEAAAYSQLADCADVRGEREQATRLMGLAVQSAQESGNLFRKAKVLTFLAKLATRRLEHVDSRAYIQESLELFRGMGIHRSVAFALGNLGFLADIDGDYTEARRCFEEAIAGAEAAQDLRLVGDWKGGLGSILLRTGDHQGGRTLLVEAVDILDLVAAPRLQMYFFALLAVEAALRSDVVSAGAYHRRILPTHAADIRLAKVSVAIAQCRRAAAKGDIDDAQLRIEEAISTSGWYEGAEAWDQRTLWLDTLLALGRADIASWSIAGDGSWFRPPGGESVPVQGAQARILARLLQLYGSDAAQIEDLAMAGWPEESMSAASASNRVHVALAGLRKLGIRPILLRTRPGWILDTSIPIREVSVEGPTIAPEVRVVSFDAT